jgi:hypothetical protein
MENNRELGVHAEAGAKDAPPFDYGSVSSSVANFLKMQADKIQRTAAKSIIDIGKDLVAAKHYLSHGQFLGWIEAEVGIPARTAQAYMQVAQWISGKSARVAHLPPSVLYVLSAPRTPQDVISDILKEVDAGKHIELSAIRGKLRALRQDRRQEGREANVAEHVQQAGGEAQVDARTHLVELINILARGLSSTDFTRVREIMTSQRVLDDPELARDICRAFSSVDGRAKNGRPLNCAAADNGSRP